MNSPGKNAAVTLVVGDEELLVERAVARLVSEARSADGGGQAGMAEDVHDVRAGALKPGELAFLAAPGGEDAQVELTYNWDPEVYGEGRNFGHLAYEVDDIYALCARLQAKGVIINRPPRDGRMAFIRSPDGVSIELLQKGDALPPTEPWSSMGNTGSW